MPSHLSSNAGVGKLFTPKAIHEKNLKPKASLNGRANKKVNASSDVLFSSKNQ